MFDETFTIFGIELKALTVLCCFLFVAAPAAVSMIWGALSNHQSEAVVTARLGIAASGLVGVGIMAHAGLVILTLGSRLVDPDRVQTLFYNALRRILYAGVIMMTGFFMFLGIEIILVLAD